MTTENQRPNFGRYEYGALATRLAQSKEDSRYVNGALEVLAGSHGLNLGEEALGFIRGTQASEEGIKTAINVYGQKFEEIRGKYTPADLTEWYSSALNGLDNEEKEKIKNTLKEHNETLGEITEKAGKAMYISQAPKGIFTSEEMSVARETLKNYRNIMEVIKALDNYKMEELRPRAVDATRKMELKGLASKL